MKNTYMKFVLFILAASLFVSCGDLENPSPINVIDETKTATISGNVTAELNTTTTGREKAPQGLNLVFTVDAKDYAVGATGTQKLTFTATTDSNGAYSVAIPAQTKLITVTVYADDFTADQVTGPTTTVKTTYKFTGANTTTIILGKKTIFDIAYNP
jgi:hypothetical protein